jgi:putative transposase
MVRNRRNFGPGGTYFFTVTLADRRGCLLTDRIDALGYAFRQCRALRPFETVAIVVLPEHLHCLWRLPDNDADCSTRWSLIKRAFTRKQYHEGSTDARARKRVWQPRYWEHRIRDGTDLEHHVEYIHYNPVRHGRARRAMDWPHSSFHRYVGLGWLTEDWACDADTEAASFGE